MPEQDKTNRRALPGEAERADSGIPAADQAISSKRLKPKDKLDKNKGQKAPGNARSGSDSNASRRTTGH